jgi:hypothetical protein
MNTYAIRKLLEAIEAAPELKPELAKLIIKLCQDGAVYLTIAEMHAGEQHGKLECVKLYKERTSKGLMESKQDCERYFELNGLQFRKPY